MFKINCGVYLNSNAGDEIVDIDLRHIILSNSIQSPYKYKISWNCCRGTGLEWSSLIYHVDVLSVYYIYHLWKQRNKVLHNQFVLHNQIVLPLLLIYRLRNRDMRNTITTTRGRKHFLTLMPKWMHWSSIGSSSPLITTLFFFC